MTTYQGLALFIVVSIGYLLLSANEVSLLDGGRDSTDNKKNEGIALSNMANRNDMSGENHSACLEGKHLLKPFRYATQPASDYFRFSINTKARASQEVSTKVQQTVSATQAIDIQRQLEAADKLYQQVLQLKSPLEQPRYQLAQYINIEISPADKAYGRAFDEVHTSRADPENKCFIRLALGNEVYGDSRTLATPAHELFHLYQNSQIMFKNGWLLEGLARWTQSLFIEGTGEASNSLPQTRAELRKVMATNYGASKMWTRLFQKIDKNDEFIIPQALAQQRYLSGAPIFADNKAYGTEFIPILFAELAAESLNVSKIKGWPPYGWREKMQSDETLNPYIWQAVKRAVNKAVPIAEQSNELKTFLAIEL